MHWAAGLACHAVTLAAAAAAAGPSLHGRMHALCSRSFSVSQVFSQVLQIWVEKLIGLSTQTELADMHSCLIQNLAETCSVMLKAMCCGMWEHAYIRAFKT